MESMPVHSALLIGPGCSGRMPGLPHMETVLAGNAEETAALLAQGSFDLAIMDGNVTSPEGGPFLPFLKVSHPNLPVLVFIDGLPEGSLARFMRQGAEAVLGPGDLSNPKELSETLSWAIGQARARSDIAFELEDAKADLCLQRTAYLKLKDSQKAAAMAMQAMSECNRLLFLLEDEHVYVRNFCRVLVKRMGLRMAWAGFLQKDPEGVERLVPAGHAGYERNYLTRFRLKSWERRYPKSLAQKVLSTGEPVTIPDLEASSVDFFRVEEALRRGYRSVILLPLKASPDARGVLCLYSGEPGAFGTSEIAYFTQVAGELAHGFELLRREARNRREIPENQE